MIQTSIGILTGIGIFLILADLFRIPYIKTSKAFNNLSNRQRKKTSTIELWLHGLATFIAKNLKINGYKRLQLVSDLQTAGMEISPELHIAGAIIKAGICGLLAIPVFFIFPLITPAVIALAFAMYFKEAKGIQSRIKKRRETIEYELPRFVFFIEKTLVHSRDVLSLLDNYRENAGEVFKYELNITVADMRSGNYESALTRLESRVGSSMLSDVVRGLISILRGDNTAVYWQALSIKFSDIQRQLLKQQAQKVPGRVKRLSMILLFCFMAVYIVVIITEIMTSLGAMFG
ncbi:MAG TPA: secretion protein F [Clostridiales bacterium]|nr:secretion protein F [Clostridiales bacterium]